MTNDTLADVALALPIDKPYSYIVPEHLAAQVRVGSIVRVPLRNKIVRGVVVKVAQASTPASQDPSIKPDAITDSNSPTPQSAKQKNRPEAGATKYKPIAALLTPEFFIAPEIVALALWIAEYYVCAPGEALRAASFIGLRSIGRETERLYALAAPEEWQSVPADSAAAPDDPSADAAPGPTTKDKARRLAGVTRISPQQTRVLDYMTAYAGEGEAASAEEIIEACAVSRAVIEGLVKRGLLAAREETVIREDDYPSYLPPSEPFIPNDAQRDAIAAITAALDARRHHTFLLHGITGSGKTEVYMQALEIALAQGRQAIILVPEIALTPQTLDRFRSRFGREAVGVFHSQMTTGQKFDLWRRITAGEARVLVGTRSAIFAPFPALGLLVVDEEHETTYKQDMTPRYHARDVGIMRAMRAGAVVILGSATPSLESWHNARTGKFTLLRLPRRVLEARLPRVAIVDMRDETAEQANPSFLSRTLREAVSARLERGEQTILFLNRRGWAPFVLCMSCRAALRCPHDDLTLTFHKKFGKAVCHICNHMTPLPPACPKCGEASLMPIGLGTEKVEEEIRRLWPAARLVRFDRDTVARRGQFLALWDRVARGEADIILGTQMIAKGFHLERVTLVGVVLADTSLFIPDFRSAERTFALLTQVAGRAGRAERPGEVIIQTFMPFHYAIGDAQTQDFDAFAEAEMKRRQLMRFPPLKRLAALTVSGADAEVVKKFARQWAEAVSEIERRGPGRAAKGTTRGEGGAASLVGAAPPPVARLGGKWRWRLLLRADSPRALHTFLGAALARVSTLPGRSKLTIAVDVDPGDLL